MNVKQQFPDEQSLQNFISEHVSEYESGINQAVGHLEVEYLRKTKSAKWGIALVLFGFFILQMTGVVATLSNWLAFGTVIFSFFAIKKGIVMMIEAKKAIGIFNDSFNQVLYPIVFGIFGLKATLAEKTEVKKATESELLATGKLQTFMRWLTAFKRPEFAEYDKVKTLLEHSELITEPKNQIKIDDIIQIDRQGKTLLVSELDVKHVTGSGKNRSVKQIFTGYFVAFDLNHNTTAKVFVSTEGDSSGFGHQNFINSMLDKGVQETKLEWNDFENLLRVATDNPLEARYILTPDLMLDLYNWWQSKKMEIRLAFIEGRMYLLFPDEKMPLDHTVKRIDTVELKKYFESICLPLLHILHLVEDVET